MKLIRPVNLQAVRPRFGLSRRAIANIATESSVKDHDASGKNHGANLQSLDQVEVSLALKTTLTCRLAMHRRVSRTEKENPNIDHYPNL